ncbi:MAG: efflux RND transporter periplasmic adaptor subunit [Planctomycetota bacterium]
MKRSPLSAVSGSSLVVAALALGPSVTSGFAQAPDPIHAANAVLSVHESVEVAAPESGVLLRVRVTEGATVGVGDRLAEVDAREARLEADLVRHDLRLAERESTSDVAVRLARKEHGVATAELARATSVNAELPGTVSAKEVDRLRLAVERTELEIEHAEFTRGLLAERVARLEADLRLAAHRVERRGVACPLPGVVAEVMRHDGEWVERGETIARVVRVDRLRVEGHVPVEAALDGLVGRPVEVAVTLPGGRSETADGRVAFVSPEAEPIDAKVRFWAVIDNASMRLRPGLAASVTILPRDGAGGSKPRDSAASRHADAVAER